MSVSKTEKIVMKEKKEQKEIVMTRNEMRSQQLLPI